MEERSRPRNQVSVGRKKIELKSDPRSCDAPDDRKSRIATGGLSPFGMPPSMKRPKSAPKTHFICLPLRSPNFLSKVTAFNATLPSTISQTITRPTGSLHFTLGVMSLTTSEEVDSAVNFLHTCHSEALSTVQNEKLTVSLKGIASMQTNLKKTSVIYAVPEQGDGRLRSLCSYLKIMAKSLLRFIAVEV